MAVTLTTVPGYVITSTKPTAPSTDLATSLSVSWPTTPSTAFSGGNHSMPVPSQAMPTAPTVATHNAIDLPSMTSGDVEYTFSMLKSVLIPTPPDIVLSPSSDSVPEFPVTLPAAAIEWFYNAYTSELLTTLKTKSDSLLTTSDLDGSGLLDRDAQIWDSPPMFLQSRNIKYPMSRFNIDRALYRNNINRLFALLESDYLTKNNLLYIGTRQTLEMLERQLYEYERSATFSFAKAYAEIRKKNYDAQIESYNQLLAAYRVSSALYQDKIKNEKARVELGELQLKRMSISGQIDGTRIKTHNAKVELVNTLVEAYKISMQVAEKYSKLILASAEINKLDATSAGYRAQADTIIASCETIRAEIRAMNADTEELYTLESIIRTESSNVLNEKSQLDELKRVEEEGLDVGIKAIEAGIQAELSRYDILVTEMQQRFAGHKLHAEGQRAAAVQRGAEADADKTLTVDNSALLVAEAADNGALKIASARRAGYVDAAEIEADGIVYQAQADAAALAANATLVQTLRQKVIDYTAEA